jgi:hypothetical protein
MLLHDTNCMYDRNSIFQIISVNYFINTLYTLLFSLVIILYNHIEIQLPHFIIVGWE